MTGAVLSLGDFGAAFGDNLVLADISVDVAPRAVHLLMGPAGAGKSTLLRTLAGFNDAQPSFRWWGTATYADAPLAPSSRPALVAQKARLVMASVLDNVVVGLPDRGDMTQREQREHVEAMLEAYGLHELARRLDESVVNLPLWQQRAVSVVRTAAYQPALLCVDEPVAGLDDAGREHVLDVLLRAADERALLVVTHNQLVARTLGGTTSLLAGGRLQETQRTADFLRSPKSRAGDSFVRTGSCSVPSPSAAREALSPDAEPPPPLPAGAANAPRPRGPRGFHWLRTDELGGGPRPGVVADAVHDLAGLRDVGVNVLVCLEEERTVPEPLLRRFGIHGLFFPIDDMCAPELEPAAEQCALVERLIERGRVVCVHCRAGLGRTGTMLAAQLIWRGARALDALEEVRRVQPRWVQSDTQVEFLRAFADHVSARNPPPSSRMRAQ